MAKIQRNVISKEFRLGVDPEEREELSKEHCAKCDEIDALKQQAADTAATFRQTIKERREEEKELRLQLKQGKPQVLEVEECRDFGKNEIFWKSAKDQFGIKKGKELERRPMTEEDDQPPLPSEPDADEPDEA